MSHEPHEAFCMHAYTHSAQAFPVSHLFLLSYGSEFLPAHSAPKNKLSYPYHCHSCCTFTLNTMKTTKASGHKREKTFDKLYHQLTKEVGSIVSEQLADLTKRIGYARDQVQLFLQASLVHRLGFNADPYKIPSNKEIVDAVDILLPFAHEFTTMVEKIKDWLMLSVRRNINANNPGLAAVVSEILSEFNSSYMRVEIGAYEYFSYRRVIIEKAQNGTAIADSYLSLHFYDEEYKRKLQRLLQGMGPRCAYAHDVLSENWRVLSE